MIVGRCFDIQRAVMLALYCCQGNYDELFYIGWYLRVLSLSLAHAPSSVLFFIIALVVQFLVAPYIWLNCRFFSCSHSLRVVCYAIWLDSHSCSSFNCILSVDCCFAFEHVEKPLTIKILLFAFAVCLYSTRKSTRSILSYTLEMAV